MNCNGKGDTIVMSKYAVIGAGISGLSAAHFIQKTAAKAAASTAAIQGKIMAKSEPVDKLLPFLLLLLLSLSLSVLFLVESVESITVSIGCSLEIV